MDDRHATRISASAAGYAGSLAGPRSTSSLQRRSKREKERLEAAQVKDQLEAVQIVMEHEFHPEVFAEEVEISIWLPELDLMGTGENLEEAKEALLELVRDYVEEYRRRPELQAAPNRQHHFPFVVRAMTADQDGSLDEVLFSHLNKLAAA